MERFFSYAHHYTYLRQFDTPPEIIGRSSSVDLQDRSSPDQVSPQSRRCSLKVAFAILALFTSGGYIGLRKSADSDHNDTPIVPSTPIIEEFFPSTRTPISTLKKSFLKKSDLDRNEPESDLDRNEAIKEQNQITPFKIEVPESELVSLNKIDEYISAIEREFNTTGSISQDKVFTLFDYVSQIVYGPHGTRYDFRSNSHVSGIINPNFDNFFKKDLSSIKSITQKLCDSYCKGDPELELKHKEIDGAIQILLGTETFTGKIKITRIAFQGFDPTLLNQLGRELDKTHKINGKKLNGFLEHTREILRYHKLMPKAEESTLTNLIAYLDGKESTVSKYKNDEEFYEALIHFFKILPEELDTLCTIYDCSPKLKQQISTVKTLSGKFNGDSHSKIKIEVPESELVSLNKIDEYLLNDNDIMKP